MKLERFVDQEQIRQQRAQVDRCVEVVDELRSDGWVREHEPDGRPSRGHRPPSCRLVRAAGRAGSERDTNIRVRGVALITEARSTKDAAFRPLKLAAFVEAQASEEALPLHESLEPFVPVHITRNSRDYASKVGMRRIDEDVAFDRHDHGRNEQNTGPLLREPAVAVRTACSDILGVPACHVTEGQRFFQYRIGDRHLDEGVTLRQASSFCVCQLFQHCQRK